MVNSRALYISLLGKKAREKYGSMKEPMSYVAFPLMEGGPELFSEERQEEIYQQCIRDDKPWQEYPEIVRDVKKWHREYLRRIRKGEIF